MPVTASALPALPVGADNRSITERFNAVLRNLYNKLLPVGAANTVLTSDGTTFSWATPAAIVNTGATTFLTSNIALNNIANYFDGPNTGSIGASGQTWLITATACMDDTAGAANLGTVIFDGTNQIASSSNTSGGAAFEVSTALAVVVTLTAATTFTLRAKDVNTVNGRLLSTGNTGATVNLATSITAVRLA